MRVAIIGAGIVGTSIARELSHYSVEIHVFEKNEDVGMGTSKANTGIIHAGFDDPPGTLRAKYCARGNALWHQWVKELNIPAAWRGEIVVALSDNDLKTLEDLRRRGIENGVDVEIWDAEKVKNAEPNLTKSAKGALYAPTGGVIESFMASIAVMENAVANGAHFHFNEPVIHLEEFSEGIKIKTPREDYIFDLVINAAGLYADSIAKKMGFDFKITPRKGEYLLFKKNTINLNYIIFPAPTKISKGVVVENTPAGNLMIGPNAQNISSKEDLSTTQDGLEYVYSFAKKLVPGIPPRRDSIKQFAGLRAEPEGGDFIITTDGEFWNVAGIRSPGLTAAPAIAEDIVNKIANELDLKPKERFINYRKPYPVGGKIICECEAVSEMEIREAVRRGAATVEAVQRRTRAGMGTCQATFCLARVMKIISEERNIPFEKVEFKKGAPVVIEKLR